MDRLQPIFDESVALLHRLTTKDGILASTIEADNYKRIWARDSVVCGLAGLLLKDETITEGLKNSLLTLAGGQHEIGMIPSNIMPSKRDDLSYGSLMGRIDSNTWFIIGCCLYYSTTSDEASWTTLEPAVRKCRSFLKSVEYNDKGWIYTPLSGNWADEYPVHGYTLYDNTLRIWGEKLWNSITGESYENWDKVLERTRTNFWPNSGSDQKYIYHQHGFEQSLKSHPGHYAAFILPGHYDLRFDAAGNALALLLLEPDNSQKDALVGYLESLDSELGKHLIPAFWPVIEETDFDWPLLRGNYSFSFKNKPGYFHNGGIWPVWMGLFCLGLAQIGLTTEARKIVEEFTTRVIDSNDWDFQEYLNARDFSFDGKTQMGYTASGVVFMYCAVNGIPNPSILDM